MAKMGFLQRFFEGTTRNIELRTVPAVARIFTRDEKLLNKFIEQHPKTHIYFGCCTREGNTEGDKKHCAELVAFWSDIDFMKTKREDADKAITAFPFKPSVTIFSGGGYHLYWLLKECCDAHDQRCEPTLKGISATLNADMSGAELARILRVPGTMNYKYNPPRRVEIVKADWGLRYNVDDFEVFKMEAITQAESIGARTGKIGPGARTAALVSLAGSMNRKGMTLEEAMAAMLGLNSRFNPPHEKQYVEEKAKSIYEQYGTQHGGTNGVITLVETMTADGVVPEPLAWLWLHRIPLGKLTVFVGMPDVGKSTVAIDVVARCTTGEPWPGTEEARRPQEVLMLVSEDDLTDTAVPRLMAAKADLNKVHFAMQTKIIDTKKGSQATRRIALDQDLKSLELILAEHPEIKLVIIDPLGSYLGKLKKNAEEDIRGVLTELKEMAERTKVAVISIDHFNKNVEQSALHRLSGAGALAAVPRAVWGFVKDKDDPEKLTRLMLNAKLNVVSERNKAGLKYRSVGVEFFIKNTMSNLPTINWLGESVGDLDEILHEKNDPDKTKVGKCGIWLQERLAKGAVLSTMIYTEGANAGFSEKTIRRSGAQLGITHVKTTGGWRMELPKEMGETEDV